ncbi:hypothetical protein [Bacteroides sp. KFT8]|jgi:hypothetical protein|uniref:hypothetical protein n=1 Tax=Bacteroides sp. KFT8 TaxID=2025659 RepID=UPI000C04553F|nr:hypothetical protein [Bacteroides sp. KFT8]
MDDKKLHRCFTFSEEQLKHLRSKKYKIDRMECFMSLVDLAEPVAKLVQISKTKQVEILAGQVMVDNTQLAKLWDKDRKTVPKLLDAMEAVGIFSSQEVEDNRIYTLHCLSGWYVDAKFVSNHFALKRNNDSTAIIHAEVPASKVIITEDPDDKKNKEGSASGSDKSKDSAEGNNPQTTGNVSHQSPQSNDSGNVGKSGADGNKSPSPPVNNSHQSADSTSPQGEADGKQNEGKVNEQTPSQQGGQQPGTHPQQPNGNHGQAYNGYQKPNGYYNQNGNK